MIERHLKTHRTITRTESHKHVMLEEQALEFSGRLNALTVSALRRIDAAITRFRVNDEMKDAMVKLGVRQGWADPLSRKHGAGEDEGEAEAGLSASMVSELRFALSPFKVAQELAKVVKAMITLTGPAPSPLHRFRRAAYTCSFLIRISRSPQVPPPLLRRGTILVESLVQPETSGPMPASASPPTLNPQPHAGDDGAAGHSGGAEAGCGSEEHAAPVPPKPPRARPHRHRHRPVQRPVLRALESQRCSKPSSCLTEMPDGSGQRFDSHRCSKRLRPSSSHSQAQIHARRHKHICLILCSVLARDQDKATSAQSASRHHHV